MFEAVALGCRNSEIAEMSFLSVKTIETCKARLMQKLCVHSRAELVRYALELDILEQLSAFDQPLGPFGISDFPIC